MRDKRRWLLLALVLLGGLRGLGGGRTAAQEAERFFPETNHVGARALFGNTGRDHGGLAQQGYPI